ncbi:cytokinesis protein Cyk3 [Emericellopsis atlantica]|uniref:Cytokinesis protein Cyk3 n=1 Tax=Emericellopsis atlantica TaxID=2614577 RepID=A0A9P8CL95_9HYPO|nr:cytokinesis protein Cyk3 [Emericellopsis atlantica]KAG9250857.1 cytokinesis protein Cyk3 [Emericellopsis atlantica]
MPPAAPSLPVRFPCWCRAVYSWGGESKRDLGFVEGDLIECLNAGDGSWWVGRLFRDRRSVGSFPSNFVEVLPANFRPTTKSISPLPDSNTPSPKNTPQKSKTFRKPFEAYSKAPHYTTAKQPEVFKEVVKPRQRGDSSASFANSARPNTPLNRAISPAPAPSPAQQYASRAPSPAPSSFPHHARMPSPAPPPSREYARVASPAPPMHHYARAPSPAPPAHDYSRVASPAPPMHHYARGPSPAPPAHDYSRVASPAPPMHYHGRGPSPAPRQEYLPRAISPAPAAHDYMRAASPAPPPPHHALSRGPSPAPSFGRHSSFDVRDGGDSPPPPPPPHRHAAQKPSADFEDTPYALSRHGSNGSFAPYNPYVRSRHGSNASYNPDTPLSRNGSSASHREHQEEPKTPGHEQYRAASPAGSHMTPSPLREAMDGVMEQLDELSGYSGHEEKGSPTKAVDLWSPESFDMGSRPSQRRQREQVRPLTSMGIANVDEGYETWSGGSSQEASLNGGQKEKAGLPKLNNYVARMESQFQKMHQHSLSTPAAAVSDMPPPPPPKGQMYERPKSSMGSARHGASSDRQLGSRKSAYDVGRGVGRTYTTKTNTTEQSHTSSSTQSSDRTLWSGESAGGFSATSAGSLARNAPRPQSAFGMRHAEPERPETPFTGVTYHSSHASNYQANKQSSSQAVFQDDTTAGLGGLVQPKAPRRNIFKKIFESAKTGVASGRAGISGTTMGSMDSAKPSPLARSLTSGTPSMLHAGTLPRARDSVPETGPGSGVDWVQVRRDVNRSNSLSQNERLERHERCQMLDHPTLNPVDELYQCVEGDEGADGNAVADPVNYHAINLSQVDKNSRFIAGLPPTITAITLATTYICRPYRSDVQRLRAIFTWVSEKICWEEDFEGEIDTRQVIQSKRACAEEYAVLVQEMCSAIGIDCEIIRGYLKIPGEVPDLNMMPRSNHWWNAVIVDGEWRLVDCCLASPSNPRRSHYSNAANNTADFWYFLTRPVELCWTHVPEHHDQQHIVPPVAHETLLNLPCTNPTFFRQGIEMVDYSTSLNRIEDLEMVHIKFNVPADVEIAAEVEARAYTRDTDGDVFESGDVVKKRALAQAEWFNGVKKYTVKALLPGDEGQGTLKIYAGKRGLMHSIKDIPHPLAFSLPIIHTGENPPYDFVTRHPTPHAQRHDIYVVQPQCQRLALNNTFVFAIRQHPSSLCNGPHSSLTPASNPGCASPVPFARPSSAMSMNASTSGTMSNPSSASGTVAGKKPAKLAIQTPGGKILRLMRKEDRRGISVGSKGFNMDEEVSDGGTWETIIKCSEKGTWRGLVLADRTARWCVFAEWTCVG